MMRNFVICLYCSQKTSNKNSPCDGGGKFTSVYIVSEHVANVQHAIVYTSSIHGGGAGASIR